MKREVVYLKVKVVLEYETKEDRRAALDGAKEGVTDVSEACFGSSRWAYRATKVVVMKTANCASERPAACGRSAPLESCATRGED